MNDLKWIPMMSADGAEGGSTPEVASTAETSASEVQSDSGNAGGKEERQPFAIFPDEASFKGRVNREANKQMKEFLKSLGVEKEEDLKSIIKTHQETIESSKTELQKAKELADKAMKEKTEFLNQYTSSIKQNEAKVKALALGIKPERLDYVLKLVDLSDVEIEDGKVDSASIEKKLNSLIKEFPELKGINPASTQKGGQDFSESKASPELLSIDMIKAMSLDEVEKRLPDILNFMNRK